MRVFNIPNKTVDVVVDEHGAPVATAKSVSTGTKRARSTAAFVGQLSGDVPPAWRAHLADEFDKSYFRRLERNVVNAYDTTNVFPSRRDVFRALALVPPDHVRVVIIGQDPYVGFNQAHGLCFSVPRARSSLPPSLRNIIRELEIEYKGNFSMRTGGDLTCWAEQGVLLLNASLTVEARRPGSHASFGWHAFTDRVIQVINECSPPGVVFMLWGSFAKQKAPLVRGMHHMLRASHPSPKSADRGFFGCGHFVRCNQLLAQHQRPPIEWGTKLDGSPLEHPRETGRNVSLFGSVTTYEQEFGGTSSASSTATAQSPITPSSSSLSSPAARTDGVENNVVRPLPKKKRLHDNVTDGTGGDAANECRKVLVIRVWFLDWDRMRSLDSAERDAIIGCTPWGGASGVTVDLLRRSYTLVAIEPNVDCADDASVESAVVGALTKYRSNDGENPLASTSEQERLHALGVARSTLSTGDVVEVRRASNSAVDADQYVMVTSTGVRRVL